MYKLFFKRCIDIVISLVILIMILPILIFVTVFLFFANQGSPFFIQERPGLNGVIFKIIKFKTMNDKKDELGNFLPDSERLTKIGNFIRKTSFDEFPQFINVLIGDMSVIGPRPLLKQYLHLYNDFQKRRHEIKPGITGWAQVNGRNAISWEKKFEFDVWYVDNCSFFIDLEIMMRTVLKVINREGINGEDVATIEPFNGEE